LPKEKKVLHVEYDLKNLGGEKPLLKVEGWNVKAIEKELK
jgi:hypothetical protein